ncbi:T9SS type A sorting domain-containing protein, partial [Flavobacteriales bacterium]|nr:T9SS type A sorting domain-containing protein [Flavobacteriales bacterium]
IYPNPSRDIFNVSFTSVYKQDLKVRILNIIGEELINENLVQFIGEYTKQINLSDNAKGIYFLEIETNDGVVNKKLILQ